MFNIILLLFEEPHLTWTFQKQPTRVSQERALISLLIELCQCCRDSVHPFFLVKQNKFIFLLSSLLSLCNAS